MASGESFRSLALRFRVGVSTVSLIVKETCNIIWEVLQNEYLPHPTTDIWLKTAKTYFEKWNFPNCIGALDGKHIEIKCPSNSGSTYYNYKQFFSISLQALVDADGKLLVIDVGGVGRHSDSGLFRSSLLYSLLEKGELNVPSPTVLPNTNFKVPYVIVADEGYPLLTYIMRPFPQRNLNDQKRIFNYRLSRARRSVECSFGMLSCKWRILLKPIETDVKTAVSIVKAVCILHNYILEKEGQDPGYLNLSNTRSTIQQQTHTLQHRFQNSAVRIREAFMHYFNGVGSVAWQQTYALPQNILHNFNK